MLSTGSPTFKHANVNSRDLPLLGDIAIIRLLGPDAEAFAQSQLMNDVLALEPGRWQWNGWLSAKGRVQALFALARVAPGDLLVLLLDQPAGPFKAALERFVLRRKVRIIDEASLGAFAEWAAGAPEGDGRDALLRAEGDPEAVGFDLTAEGGPRRCWVAVRGDAQVDPDATRRWRDADLRHGMPRAAPDRDHGWTPHMLSLDRLKAFSVRKGCYPGQEIVARTHFLGQAKRQAWWITGRGLAAGQAVMEPDGRSVGELVDATADGLGALAVAALGGPGRVRCGEAEAEASVPLAGLARPG
jgi:folate-binding protein YgfZ